MSDSITFTSSNGARVYYVYPRLMSFMDKEDIKVETLSNAAKVSKNTVSKLRSGENVSDKTVDKCKAALKLINDKFDFEIEKMAAQGNYRQEDVRRFIGNRPYEEAAKELGIQKYMLEWILAEKKVSEDFHKKYIASKV